MFLDTSAVSVSLWDLMVNVQISTYKKWRLISLDRQNVVLLVLILTQKKHYYLHFFPLQIIVSVKMSVTFSFIKVHNPIVIFTLLVKINNDACR